jgi:spore germination cell wall hydrolase CwlJ-like protein
MEDNNMRRLFTLVMMIFVTLPVLADESTPEEPTPILTSINDVGTSMIEARNNVLDSIVDFIPFVRIPNDVPEKEIKCLADNIYFEAKSEPLEGKMAVAEVTLNRVEHPQYPKTVCGVVWQQNKDRRTGRKVAQFSWTLDGRPDVPKSKETYQEIYALAEEILLYGMDSAIVGPQALFYHATYVKPRWSRQMEKIVRIGNHIFYQPRI